MNYFLNFLLQNIKLNFNCDLEVLNMAKRGAGSELNHDNWDQEEESEEAGEFKKASEDQMKGRVVKKAKRRNMNEEQKKNVFAGFGGFTSNNRTAQDAFSFLAKPAVAAETKAGFSFGGSPNNSNGSSTGGLFGSSDANSTGIGFSFGGNSNGDKATFSGISFGSTVGTKKDDKIEDVGDASKDNTAKNGNDLFSSFKSVAGNWSCNTCMVSNSSDKSKCSACETPKPNIVPEKDLMCKFKPASGSWSCSVCMVSNKPDLAKCQACETPNPASASKDDLFAKFKASSGNWSCEACMVSNPSDKTKCVACETPNPKAVAAAAAPADDLFAKFKSASGNWSCDVCMVSNDASKDKCVACETAKPGTKAIPAATEAKSTFSFGEGGGFKFGGGSQPPASSSLTGFKFGSTEPSKPVESGGFKFGSSEPDKPVVQESGFKFGVSESSKPVEEELGFKFGSFETPKSAEKVPGFKLGSCSTTEQVAGFQFGTDSPIPAKQSQVFKSAAGGFQFSSSENGAKLTLEATDTPKTKSKKGEYLANLKALNTQVTNWIKSHVDENPLVDLTPVFKDYEKHITELRSKFNVQVSLKPVENATNPEEKKEDVKQEEPKPFSFGLNQSGFGALSSGFGSNTSSFQFGFLKKDENKSVEIESEEDSSNTVEVVETVVETDAIYTKKCKLFYKKGDSYVERGLGNIHLKKTEESKLQVIIRADTTLGNILFNIIMTDQIPLERVGKNNVMIICIPNPPIDPKSEAEPVTFLIRVKNAVDADELKEKLTELAKSEA